MTDIPPVPRPQVTEYRVQIGRCLCCGKRVRGRHPDVAPDQYGASAHRVGRRVMAAAHVLHYGVGIPVRRVPSVLRALTGVELSQGAITQDALRRAQGAVGDAYRRLRESVRESAVRPHRRHWVASGWRGRLPDGVRDRRCHGVPGACSSPQRKGERGGAVATTEE